jgi:DNA-binding transcriptional LysR family regulator
MTNRLEDMQVFIAVVESGSFSAAARQLAKTPSAVSKLVQRLEDRLGTQLFYRNSRNLQPTEAGRTFFHHSQKVVEAMADAEASVSDRGRRPHGMVRLSTMPTFARYQLAKLMPEFSRRYPDLRIEFQLESTTGDLFDQRVDLSIRSGTLPDSSLVARPLATSRWSLCASPAYLARAGVPREPGELARHRCLLFAMQTPWNHWRFTQGPSQGVALGAGMSANQGEMLIELARCGMGITRLARFHIHDDLRAGRLVHVLQDFEAGLPEPLYVVYPARRNLSPKVAVVIEFLEEKFGGKPPWEEDVATVGVLP